MGEQKKIKNKKIINVKIFSSDIIKYLKNTVKKILLLIIYFLLDRMVQGIEQQRKLLDSLEKEVNYIFYSIFCVFSCNLKIFRDIISHNCPGTL